MLSMRITYNMILDDFETDIRFKRAKIHEGHSRSSVIVR